MAISFNSVPSGARVPLVYVEFDSSRAGATSGVRIGLFLIGQRLSAGTVAEGVPTLVNTVAEAQVGVRSRVYAGSDGLGVQAAEPVRSDVGGGSERCDRWHAGGGHSDGRCGLDGCRHDRALHLWPAGCGWGGLRAVDDTDRDGHPGRGGRYGRRSPGYGIAIRLGGDAHGAQ